MSEASNLINVKNPYEVIKAIHISTSVVHYQLDIFGLLTN